MSGVFESSRRLGADSIRKQSSGSHITEGVQKGLSYPLLRCGNENFHLSVAIHQEVWKHPLALWIWLSFPFRLLSLVTFLYHVAMVSKINFCKDSSQWYYRYTWRSNRKFEWRRWRNPNLEVNLAFRVLFDPLCSLIVDDTITIPRTNTIEILCQLCRPLVPSPTTM